MRYTLNIAEPRVMQFSPNFIGYPKPWLVQRIDTPEKLLLAKKSGIVVRWGVKVLISIPAKEMQSPESHRPHQKPLPKKVTTINNYKFLPDAVFTVTHIPIQISIPLLQAWVKQNISPK